ncbi:response regulator transcription factor [Sporomusa sp.]|jgi:two-component system response regulator CssR|uniref:response regulator transcription factor n=1 Tax=Sporomusa sp. TaxID=2078658 RepID=UPI002C1DA96C|nr:response regulator transcription factor [Sporomusa sp.]MDF2873997.1 two component transcriptional regulator, winged helix family [Sporomusa sp.]HWR07510.1 response regulator transcription factor [Sporomusa sp.]
MTPRVFLSERNETFSQMLTYYLQKEGWEVTSFSNDTSSLLNVADCPNLWILDADGEEWVNIMRKIQSNSTQIPIILTSEHENTINRVWGFELGCADFIVKPFMPKELVFRARKILNPHDHGSVTETATKVTRLQNYHLDLQRRMILVDKLTVDLTSKEFDLLCLFARHKGIALSREQILTSVWGENYFGSDRVVDDLIRRVRRKLTTLEIDTVYGYGYRIVS